MPKESVLCRMSNISIFSLHINFVPYDDTVVALHEGGKLLDVQCKHRGGMSPTNQDVGGLISVSAPMDPWENVDFGKEVNAVNNCKPSVLCTVSGEDNTAALWRQHYTTLYNNGPMSVLTREVYEAIHKVFDSKACGLDHRKI